MSNIYDASGYSQDVAQQMGQDPRLTTPRGVPPWLQSLLSGAKNLFQGGAENTVNTLFGQLPPQPQAQQPGAGAQVPSAPPTAPQAPIAPASPFSIKQARPQGNMNLQLPMGASPTYESRLNTVERTGQNPNSTASGPWQFTNGTFGDFIKAVHPDIAKDFDSLPDAGQTAFKNHWMTGPQGVEAKNWLLGRNSHALAVNNVPVNDATLYGAHFLGPADMVKLQQADPNTPVAQILSPKSIQANPEVLSGKTVGEVKAWLQKQFEVLPQPPTLGAPPQQALPKDIDFSKYTQFLDQTKPTAQEHMQNVLGGLAQGAASVPANEPGSFARALAMAGAGGMKGAQESSAAFRTYAANRAHDELGMLTMQHGVEKDRAQVALQNAQSVYDTQVKNQLTQYEHQLKTREALAPKISHDANGILIQQLDPNTNQVQTQFHSTKPIMEQMEKLESVMKAVGGENTPLGQALTSQLIPRLTGGNPVLAQEVYTRKAMDEVLKAGAGSSVFGQAFTKAVQDADKEVNIENPGAATKPEFRQQLLMDKVASKLLTLAGGDAGWLKRAKGHSATAAILSGAGSGD